MNHCDDSDGNFLKEMKARDISKYLVDYRGHKKEIGKEDESMYPFQRTARPTDNSFLRTELLRPLHVSTRREK